MADTTQEAASNTNNLEQQIDTHHCICSNLLFATTFSLSRLPRRGGPSLDSAYILPCPRMPPPSLSSLEEDPHSDDDDTVLTPGTGGPRGYTALVSLAVPARQAPVIIRRSDGFEKRWVLRCGRCKLAVAYHLDWSQFEQKTIAEGKVVAGSGGGGNKDSEVRKGRREDVLYVLPGALMTTEEMLAGKKFGEREMGFGLAVV